MKFKLVLVIDIVVFDENVELVVATVVASKEEAGSHLSTSARIIKQGTSKI